MTTNDLDQLLETWMDTAEPMTEPHTLLPAVFAVTRATRQQRGVSARFAAGLRFGGVLPWQARPILGYALLTLLLVALLAAAAVAGGFFRRQLPTGWRMLDSAPLAGESTWVSAIVTTEAGFLAIGNSEVLPEGGGCRPESARGRAWSSVDGDSWRDVSESSLVGVRIDKVFVANGYVYAFGFDNVCYDGDGPRAASSWRSADGVAWEKLPDAEMLSMGNIPELADVRGTMVAVGVYQPFLGDGNYGALETRIWSSTDGSRWDHAGTIAGVLPGGLAEKNGTLVMLGYREGEPGGRLSTSDDGGRTWAETQPPSGVADELQALAADDKAFVAVADGLAVTSMDGKTWSLATDAGALKGVLGLRTVSNGLMAIRTERRDGAKGQECRAGGLENPRPSGAAPDQTDGPAEDDPPPYPTDYCYPVAGSGGTALSSDGSIWRTGPDLPAQPGVALFGEYVVGAAYGALLVAHPAHPGSIWYASLDDFRP